MLSSGRLYVSLPHHHGEMRAKGSELPQQINEAYCKRPCPVAVALIEALWLYPVLQRDASSTC